MVKELLQEYENIYGTETEYDGMQCDEFSEPFTDWDYESEQP